MAVSIDVVRQLLDAEGLKYKQRDEQTLTFGFGGLDHYRDADGDPMLSLVIQLLEDGEYFKLFAPLAYKIEPEQAAEFLQACAMIQWKTKLIQFEFDQRDGEVRPIVEFPIEDSMLTRKQLMRCVRGIVTLIDEYDPILRRVMEGGDIEFNEEGQAADKLLGLLDSLPPQVVEEALRRVQRGRDRE